MISGSLLIQNAGDIVGQIILPQNDTHIMGEQEVRMIVNDNTNIQYVELHVFGGPGKPIDYILMAWNPSLGLYSTILNTTEFPDGYYDLQAEIWLVKDLGLYSSPRITVLIDNTPPDLRIQTPTDGDILVSTTNLMAEVSDTILRLPSHLPMLESVEYDLDGQGFLAMAPAESDPDIQYFQILLDPSIMVDGLHEVVVKATDRARLVSMDNVSFYTDTKDPVVAPVYVPAKGEEIAGDFKFAFSAEDPSGIREGKFVIGDNKTEFIIPRNPGTGLYEYDMDTTQFKDGSKVKYCAVFIDNAGREAEYCSNFKVDNSGTIEDPPPTRTIKETDWFPWILLAIVIIISILVLIFLIRERYLRKTEAMEAELLRKHEEEELEGAKTKSELPDDVSAIDKVDEKEETSGYKPPGVKVKLEREGKKKKAKDATYELSALTPALITPKATLPPELQGGKDEPIPVTEGEVIEAEAIEDKPKKKKGKKKRFVRCPMCQTKINVKTKKRPLVLSCHVCGAKGKLR
jgi:hypothetical protein